MKTFKDIKVWQKSMNTVTTVYKITTGFPKEEQFGITNQIRRSSVSIPSNIAEGFGRRSPKEFKRYLNIAMGSLFELLTQLEICYNLNYLNKNDFQIIYEETREIERMLVSFINSIKTN